MIEPKTICLNDEDLLTEILEKLPLKSISRCKAVSPEWRDLLSSPAFLRRYAASHRPSVSSLAAFFQQARAYDAEEPSTIMHCNILQIRNNNLGSYSINVPKHVGNFVGSSNGLILCDRLYRDFTITYSVGNPFTGKFVELPRPKMGNGRLQEAEYRTRSVKRPTIFSTTLICEENTNNLVVPVYTVLRVGAYEHVIGDEAKTIYIDSYSSKTGEWSVVSTLELPRTAYLCHEPSVVANGIVHWRAMDGRIVVYNPSEGDRHVKLINMPHYHKQDSFTFTRSAGSDVLWLAVQLGIKLLFYTLPKERDYKREVAIGEEEWELMEEVSIFDISRIRKKALVACKRTTLECLIPEPRDEIVAVLRQEERLFFYNVQSKSIAKVEYCGRYNNRHRLHPYFQPSFLSACL